MSKRKSNSNSSTSLKVQQKFQLGALVSLIITAGVLSVLEITKINSGLDLHQSPVCAPNDNPYKLDWNTSSWPAGSLSKTYTNVDGSGINFSFSYAGHTSKFDVIGTGQTPNIQDFFPSESIDALSHYVDPGFGIGENITLTIDISPAIPANLAFDVYHVNGTGYSGDKLTIYAQSSTDGQNIYPSFTDNGSPSWEDEGNGTIDATGGSVASNKAYAGVNFNSSTYINKLIIIWTECDKCGGGVHGWGLGNIDFCTSVQDTDQDNILDAIDIDDDNDGIPDIEEVCGISTSVVTGDITVEVQLDGYADIDNVAWTLKNSSGTTVLSGGPYSSANNNTLITAQANGAAADVYTFQINDDWGDGLCCNNQGYYQIKVDGAVVVGPVVGNFGSSSSGNFSISSRSFSCLSEDPSLDHDGDGIVNYKDADFCSLNAAGVCSSLDKDSDGIPDYLDLDSDNDGIPDIVEAGGADSNGDGRVDNPLDTDEDGLANVFETAHGITSILIDSNGDGISDILGDFDDDNIVNWLDLDSDGDGITDVVEAAGNDTDNNGQIDNYSTDADADGFADGVDGDVGNDGTAENTALALVPSSSDGNGEGRPDSGYPKANTDGTGKPNFLDIDADDDGIVDNTEAQATGSYLPPSGNDEDADGIDNAYDNNKVFGGNGLTPVNTDLTDEPDYLDLDSDADLQSDKLEGHDSNGDNVPDASSPANTGVPTGNDVDGDGLDDGYDNNLLARNPSNSGLSPSMHPLADGGKDQDWRAQTLFPVEWVSFEATWQGKAGYLSWETAMELNTRSFQVERAIGNRQLFQPIGQVDASGNSSELQSYEYVDSDLKDLGFGEKIFYRLKQIDIDGQFEYSAVVELVASTRLLNLSLYPNPATEFVTLKINNGNGSTYLKIVNIEGKTMLQRKIQDTKNAVKLDLQTWAKGIYMVYVEDEKGRQNAKLIVK